MKYVPYIVNINEYMSIESDCIALCINDDSFGHIENFGVEHIRKEMKEFTGNKNIITNTFRTQAYDSKMCGYICTGFIDFMSKDKSLAYLQTSAYHAIPK